MDADEKKAEEIAEERSRLEGEKRRDRFLRDFFENSELYTFGIITQKGYKDLEERLAEHAKEVQDKFHRWFVWGLVAYSIIAITSTVALFGFGVLLSKAKQNTAAIQQQRRDTIRAGCEDQNQRHDLTIRRLNVAMSVAIRRHPERKDEIRQSSEVSIGLIDALVPHQDCDQKVREATQ